MIRFGRIPYINVLPIFEGLHHLDLDLPFVDWIYAPPSELSELFASGKLDVSFLSLGSYFHLRDKIHPLGNFGISAWERAHSVCLYTRVPLWELHHRPLYVTSQSQTSILLLQVMCKQFWNVHPHFFLLDDKPIQNMDAYLLIGDACLEHTPSEEYQVIDLANAWHLATALPFTFALLVCRKGLTSEQEVEVGKLTLALQKSHHWFTQNKERVAKIATAQSTHDQSLFNRYFHDLKYLLDDKAYKGIQVFHNLSTQSKKKVFTHA